MKQNTGIIISIKKTGVEFTGVAYTNNGEIEFTSKDFLPKGSCVIIKNQSVQASFQLLGTSAKDAYCSIAAKLIKQLPITKNLILPKDKVIQNLSSLIFEIASDLVVAQKLSRATLMRFHGDADGACGALSILSILPNTKAIQQNSAVYGIREANYDVETLAHQTNPLAILVDFGSGEANEEGIKQLKASGIEVTLIDHHPVSQKIIKETKILNAQTEFQTSLYTAGYLCAEIAIAAGSDRTKSIELARTACAGDRSTILELGDSDSRRAMVLDFLTSHKSFGNKLELYAHVLSNQDMFESTARQAEDEISEIGKKALAGVKIDETGKIVIASVALDKLVKKGEWPPSSKVTTYVFEALSSKYKSLVVIGSVDRSILIRANDGALKFGIGANILAEKLKTSMPDFVDSGGGHAKAGAIRVKAGFGKDVIRELVREINSTT